MSIAFTPHYEDASRRGWQHRLHLDAPLLFALIAVSALGLIVLYSAGGGDIELVERQLVRLGIAFTGMLVVAQFPPRLLQRLTPWIFVIGILLLLAVLISGEASGGAQRWLNLYFVRFQPSEMMKLAVPMMVAWYLANTRLPPTGDCQFRVLRGLSGRSAMAAAGLFQRTGHCGRALTVALYA